MRHLPCNCTGCRLGLRNTCSRRLIETVNMLTTYHARDALQEQLEAAERTRIAYQQTAAVCCPEVAVVNQRRMRCLAGVADIVAALQVRDTYTDGQRWEAALVIERMLGAMACEHIAVAKEACQELIAIYNAGQQSRRSRPHRTNR